MKEEGRLAKGSWLSTALLGSEPGRFKLWPRTRVVLFWLELPSTVEASTADFEAKIHNGATTARSSTSSTFISLGSILS